MQPSLAPLSIGQSYGVTSGQNRMTSIKEQPNHFISIGLKSVHVVIAFNDCADMRMERHLDAKLRHPLGYAPRETADRGS